MYKLAFFPPNLSLVTEAASRTASRLMVGGASVTGFPLFRIDSIAQGFLYDTYQQHSTCSQLSGLARLVFPILDIICLQCQSSAVESAANVLSSNSCNVFLLQESTSGVSHPGQVSNRRLQVKWPLVWMCGVRHSGTVMATERVLGRGLYHNNFIPSHLFCRSTRLSSVC